MAETIIHRHFKEHDPLLHSWMIRIGDLDQIPQEKPDKYFYRLCREIISQQLSDKASNSILIKFEAIFSDKFPSPSDIIATEHDKLRSAGMSHAKATYVRNLAQAVHGDELILEKLDTLTDMEVIKELTKIKGIGPWTAEMFLMFVLNRPDVFSFGDLGLKNGMKKIYGFKKDPTRKQVEKVISKWSPYKTIASRVLWKSLEL